MLRATVHFAVLGLVVASALAATTPPTQPPEMDVDVHASHRHAEAHRKAAAAARMEAALGRTTADPNQELWDVRFVDLDLSFDPDAESVSGAVGFEVTVLDQPISKVVLDLDDAMNVSAVTGDAASFTHVGDRIDVTLTRAFQPGETVSFGVNYGGTPDQSIGSFGVEQPYGENLIWSLSEPFGARAWWPCKDLPSDKADSASIKFTVPSDLIAVSNGTLENVVDLGTAKRYEWFERYPITTYLISIAAYPYTEQTLQWTPADGGDSMPVTVWSYPAQSGDALSAAYLTRDMLTAFEGMFGPYPFVEEKYGQAQFQWGGGMEHQTATTLCCWTSAGLIAHELGHQWYGDQVTCADFTQIWVNEGFATYSEALWREASEGRAGYLDEMRAARYLGDGTILVPEADLDDFGRVFSSNLSYDKGSWVLHMLRGVIGDEDFFAFLKAYASDPNVTYGVATTDDVRRVAEQVSGRDLSAFFTQWIEKPWYPTFALDWSPIDAQGIYGVDLTLSQLQTHWTFETPVQIGIVTEGGVDDRVETVEFTGSTEIQASFSTTAPVTDVVIDPDEWLLYAFEDRVESPTFDRGILLVNGVAWSTYANTIVPAYEDSVFTGNQAFEFWDVHPWTDQGFTFPSELPAPRGLGPIPPEILGQYETIVWVGNDYYGDLDAWLDGAILDYVHRGGNVLLMTRRGRNFLTQPRLDDLGTGFATSSDVIVGGLNAVHPDLVPIASTGQQSLVSPLEIPSGGSTVNLFVDSGDPSRSLGVWRQPEPSPIPGRTKGSFVHLAGRPYRWDRVALRQNTETILTQFFQRATSTPSPALRTRLESARPNPFNPRTEIEFTLERGERVTIEIFDVRGRRVRRLLDAEKPVGDGAVIWNGLDDAGHPVASGVYNVRLRAGDQSDHLKVTLVR